MAELLKDVVAKWEKQPPLSSFSALQARNANLTGRHTWAFNWSTADLPTRLLSIFEHTNMQMRIANAMLHGNDPALTRWLYMGDEAPRDLIYNPYYVYITRSRSWEDERLALESALPRALVFQEYQTGQRDVIGLVDPAGIELHYG